MTNEVKYKYKISVIVPIYKVEKYLEETILSIINQSIGFKNIQIILVNDGSPDNSEKICLKYKEMYPANIIYIAQENAGVSAARNNGIPFIKGKYINFLDSDDKYEKKAYEKGYNMLEKNPSVNLCAFRIKCFEKSNDYQGLDYKFKGKKDRVVDLTKEPDNPIYHISSVMFRSTALKNHRFDSKLKISEDMKFICEVINDSGKIAFISSVNYLYRKREEESSAIQTSTKKLTYYEDTPNYGYKYILNLPNKKLKDFFQHSIISDLKWRFYNINLSVLTPKQQKDYIETIRSLLISCDDKSIITQYVNAPLRKYNMTRMLEFKYRKPIFKDIKIKGDKIFFKNNVLMDLSDLFLEVYIFDIKKDVLKISACFNLFLNNDFDIYLKHDNKYTKFNKTLVTDGKKNIYSNDNEYFKTFFDCNFKLDDVKSFEFYIKINGAYYKINPIFTKNSKLNILKNTYFKKNGYTLTCNDSIIYINKKNHFLFIRYMSELLFKNKEILAFGLILIYKITYPFVKHDNWIISDRYNVAGDNGEWLFKYIRSNVNKKNVYFALKKNSDDYGRMEKVGNVIKFHSVNYYLKYMNSELISSSHIDNFIHKPFGRKQIYLNLFLKRKYVFLQHGIIHGDLSSWLYKYNKYMDLFICSANNEYQGILNEDYMYDKDIVKLTGLPRYDNLLENNAKQENLIAFMPTWRSSLVGSIVTGTQYREYNDKFIETEYYKFYNSLINDERLLSVLNKKKYKIIFCLHPSLKNQLKDFKENKYVTITGKVDYSDIFKRAKLMLTDYSSVFFDFAFLKKPIIYSLFDKDYVSSIHSIYSGESDFNYERDGFGIVTKDYESTLNALIEKINDGCVMDDIYKKRVDKFFKYFDNNNSKRVYNEIAKMLKEDKNEK